MWPTIARPMLKRTRAIVRATETAAAEAKALEKTRQLQRQRNAIREQYERLTTKYPAKKDWPPDFTQLSPQKQFALEKKWKRRMYYAQRANSFNKKARLWQYFLMLALVAYVFAYAEFEWNGKRYRFMTEAKHRFGYAWGYLEPDERNVRHEDIIHAITKDRKERADAQKAAKEAEANAKAAPST